MTHQHFPAAPRVPFPGPAAATSGDHRCLRTAGGSPGTSPPPQHLLLCLWCHVAPEGTAGSHGQLCPRLLPRVPRLDTTASAPDPPPPPGRHLLPVCSQNGTVPSTCTRCGPLKLYLYSKRRCGAAAAPSVTCAEASAGRPKASRSSTGASGAAILAEHRASGAASDWTSAGAGTRGAGREAGRAVGGVGPG